MPSSLPQVAAALQHALTTAADEAAGRSGFVRRRRKLSGAVFVQTLVLGWLGDPAATLSALTQVAARLGVAISPQALAQRFTAEAAALLAAVLAEAVGAAVTAQPAAAGLLGRFAGVYVLDSTTVRLPDALAGAWPGCGGRTAGAGAAALKLAVRLDLLGGRLDGPELAAGRAQDRATALQHAPVPAGALRLADLGFWSLAVFRAIAAQGAFWLSRLNVQVAVFAVDGAAPGGAAPRRLDLPAWLAGQGDRVDAAVVLGAADRLPARLVGARVPPAVAAERRRKLRAAAKREGRAPSAARLALAGWTLLVTNVPAGRLGVEEALVLARARWQVELLFKLWKGGGGLGASRSAQPWRVLCEAYAKLTALVVQHWVLLTGCWAAADRSLPEAAATVRREAASLAAALSDRDRLVAALAAIGRCLAAGCRVDKRRARPSAFQLLADPALAGLT